MQKSTNYGLNLPDLADQYNLEHWNENTEKLDLELKKETDSRINTDNQLQSNINNSVSTLRSEISTAKNLANATGVLAVTKGGTGETTAKNASNMFLNALITGQDVPNDGDFYISQWAGGSELPDTNANKNLFVRRPVSAFWTYIQNKISSVLGLTASQYNGTSAKATADGSGNNIANSYALKKGDSSDFQSNTHYFKSLGGWQNEDKVVIPILEITSSVETNRYSNGKIFSQRNNGLFRNPYFEWYCNKQYSATASEKYILSAKGIYKWEVVTFNYNSKKYLGIAYRQSLPQCHETYFDGYAYPMEEPLFTIIRYYNEDSGIINQEIYNSLTEITNYSYSGFAETATKADTATQDSNGNKIVDTYATKNELLDMALPAGKVEYLAFTPSSDWLTKNRRLICDGSAVSRTTYPRLFSAIGVTHGVGNGTSTFNLPNYIGKTLVGSKTTVTETGGSKTATLTTGNLPSHTHTMNHTHTFSDSWSYPYNEGSALASKNMLKTTTSNSGKDGDITVSISGTTSTPSSTSTGSTGSGNSFSIMNPYNTAVPVITY